MMLKGTGFYLRRFTQFDGRSMVDNWCSDPLVTQFVSWDVPLSLKAAQVLLNQWLKDYFDPHVVRFNIVDANTHQSIGMIDTVDYDLDNDTLEIGYLLARTHWNKKIMSEALRLMIDYCFKHHASLNKIIAKHSVDNAASGQVMRNAHMRLEGCMKEALKVDDIYLDVLHYAILKKEYLLTYGKL